MTEIGNLIAFIIGAVLGYMDFDWYYIFVGGIIGAFGYYADRPLLVAKIRNEKGEIGYALQFIMISCTTSLLPAIAFYIFN